MLKIKNNVDLKILKKYGFQYDKMTNTYIIKEEYCGDVDSIIVKIDWDRQLRIYLSIGKLENILFQLIKDNLVEKMK